MDVNKWFDRMRKDIELAQTNFQGGNFSAVDYFLSRLSGDIRVIREMYGRKPGESDELKKKE